MKVSILQKLDTLSDRIFSQTHLTKEEAIEVTPGIVEAHQSQIFRLPGRSFRTMIVGPASSGKSHVVSVLSGLGYRVEVVPCASLSPDGLAGLTLSEAIAPLASNARGNKTTKIVGLDHFESVLCRGGGTDASYSHNLQSNLLGLLRGDPIPSSKGRTKQIETRPLLVIALMTEPHSGGLAWSSATEMVQTLIGYGFTPDLAKSFSNLIRLRHPPPEVVEKVLNHQIANTERTFPWLRQVGRLGCFGLAIEIQLRLEETFGLA